MRHQDAHPEPVEGCFGCKCLGIGYDGKHTTRVTTDENKARITEHRDGRQDVLIRAPRTRVTTSVTEDQR